MAASPNTINSLQEIIPSVRFATRLSSETTFVTLASGQQHQISARAAIQLKTRNVQP